MGTLLKEVPLRVIKENVSKIQKNLFKVYSLVLSREWGMETTIPLGTAIETHSLMSRLFRLLGFLCGMVFLGLRTRI